MTLSADKKLQQSEYRLQGKHTARVYFDAADAANHAGNTEKATRYLRMALNTHNTELLNKFDIKSLGDTNNA